MIACYGGGDAADCGGCDAVNDTDGRVAVDGHCIGRCGCIFAMKNGQCFYIAFRVYEPCSSDLTSLHVLRFVALFLNFERSTF